MRKGISKGHRMFKKQSEIIKKSYQESFDEYIVKANIRGLSKETINTYTHQHKYFIEFLGDIKNCSYSTLKTVESYVLYLREKNMKNTTINSYLQNISPIIKYCIKQGYILEDFNMPHVKFQEEFKEILTEDELNTLLQPPKRKDFVSVRVNACVWIWCRKDCSYINV